MIKKTQDPSEDKKEDKKKEKASEETVQKDEKPLAKVISIKEYLQSKKRRR